MKIRITAGGIYGAKGEIAIGTEFDVKEAPRGWDGRYEVVSREVPKEAVPVTNPAKDDADDKPARRPRTAKD